MKPEQKLAVRLIQLRKTLALAESCSGGLLSHRLTNISGSSKFFKAGIIAYSNEAKTKILKVPKSLIADHGAVSQEIAKHMAQSVRRIFKADIGLSITGIAGPTGGTKIKPVGLTFIAASLGKATMCFKFIFKGSRLAIKTQATNKALELLLKLSL